MRRTAATRGLCLAALLTLGLASACRPAPDPATDASRSPGRTTTAALDAPDRPGDLPLTLLVPAEGTVVPWTFPRLDVQWQDGFAANTFRVRLTVPGRGVVAEATSDTRRLRLDEAAWGRVREAAGEGGAFEVALTAASALPDGTALRGPTTVVARARFSATGEHPTGHVLYSWVARSPGINPAPFNRRWTRDGVAMQEDMAGHAEPVITRFPWTRDDVPHEASSTDPGTMALQTGHEDVPSRTVDLSGVERRAGEAPWEGSLRASGNCMGCHVVSRDGAYLAVNGDDERVAMDDRDYGVGTFFVLSRADGRLLQSIPSAAHPRFNPVDPGLLLYATAQNVLDMDEHSSTLRSDVRVLDVRTGEDHAIAGASAPDRCEFFPEWSPDGRTVAFARSAPNQPCEGHRGILELATVPWNDGRGGTAAPLRGAEATGRSNVRPRYSPDGRWVVFFGARGGHYIQNSSDLFVIPASGGTPRRLEVSTDAMENWQAFSPDGKWLVFSSNRDRADRTRAYVARFFDDGHSAPAVPMPVSGGPDTFANRTDWGP